MERVYDFWMTRETLIKIVRSALSRGYADPAAAVADSIEVALMMEQDSPAQAAGTPPDWVAAISPPVGSSVVLQSELNQRGLAGGILIGQGPNPAAENIVGESPRVFPSERDIHSVKRPSRRMGPDQLREFLERKAPEHIKIRPIGKEDVELTLDRNIVFMPGMSSESSGYKLVYAHPQFSDSMQVVHAFFVAEQPGEDELRSAMEEIMDKSRNMYRARPRNLNPRPGTGSYMVIDPDRGADAD